MDTVDLQELIEIAHQAGEIILSFYTRPHLEIQHKEDNSYVTEADLAAHEFIIHALKKKYPCIPVISEESKATYSYDLRKDWESFFLVDPLDGTKEFIKRNGEFTINIALIQKNQPVIGIIHAPAMNTSYYAKKNCGAFKIQDKTIVSLKKNNTTQQPLRVIISRSHSCVKTSAFIEKLKNEGNQVTTVCSGSAIKFGLIAENQADKYPRFSPTMEWDTAAGHIIALEAGKQLTLTDGNEPLLYNKKEFINSGFIVQ